jgi:hypothetical protein
MGQLVRIRDETDPRGAQNSTRRERVTVSSAQSMSFCANL